MKKVFIINRSAHDFSAAEEYGELVFMSVGSMNRYATTNMHRMFSECLENSTAEDYIVPCSLNVMNSIACAIFAKMHGKLNLLLFRDGEYVERNLVI